MASDNGAACGCGFLGLGLLLCYLMLRYGPLGLAIAAFRGVFDAVGWVFGAVAFVFSPVGLGVIILLLILSVGKMR